jgi:hypothetical protein
MGEILLAKVHDDIILKILLKALANPSCALIYI